MWHLCLVLVSCRCVSGVICATVVEGESVTIDCGFQTTVNGGNLLWQALSNDSEISLGHIVPGDHFCGTDTLNCTVHTNGSITLIDVIVDDGDKRYRCLRGDREGYHYFSNVDLTVVSKESVGHPVIQPLTGSNANVYKIGEKGVIHSYEEPTCEDKEDGALIVTCYPHSGVIVDKVYDQVHCICTDSDGNSNSLNITVNSGHAELKENTTTVVVIVVIIIMCVTIVALVCIVIWNRHIYQLHKAENARNPENIDVCYSPRLGKGGSKHGEEGQQLNEDMDDVSQLLVNLEAEFKDKSDEIVKLNEENQSKDTTISDLKQRLIEKDADCTAKSEEIYKLKEIDLKKDMEISHLRQRLTKKEAESAGKSKDIYNLIKMNQLKDLSKKIGEEWKAVARNLGFKDPDLYKIKMDHKEEVHQEVVYQILLKWKQNEGSSATIRVLAEALKKSGRKDLHDELIAYKFETELNMLYKMLPQQLRKHHLSQANEDKKEKKKAGGEDKDDAKPKEVTAIDQVKDEKEEKNECEKDKDEEEPK